MIVWKMPFQSLQVSPPFLKKEKYWKIVLMDFSLNPVRLIENIFGGKHRSSLFIIEDTIHESCRSVFEHLLASISEDRYVDVVF